MLSGLLIRMGLIHSRNKIVCFLGLVVRALDAEGFDFLSKVAGRIMLVLFTIFSISGLIVMKLLWAIEENIRISINYRLCGLTLAFFYKLSRGFILF